MTSTFAWLDFDEPARQRMREIVGLLREEGSIDELGLGRIRDAFSDRLFPGTSVLWRRARYLLFVPWIYQLMERDGFGRRPDAESAARALQIKLRTGLLAGDDSNGLIGLRRPDPAAPPDVILWAALQQWGVRDSASGTLTQYRASLSSRPQRSVDEDAPALPTIWNVQAPQAPADFPERATFALTLEEAQFLRDLLLSDDAPPGSPGARRAGSMLADLLRVSALEDVKVPWQHPLSEQASPDLRQALAMAGCFSDVMHGATLLYARRLAEVRDDERLDAADDALDTWASRISSARLDELRAWAADLDTFFEVVDRQRRTYATERTFVKDWSILALKDPGAVARSRDAVRLVEDREAHSKRSKARLTAPRDRDRGDGGAIPTPLTYRWANAQQLVADIRRRLEG